VREIAATTGYAVGFSRPAPPLAKVPVVGRTPRITLLLAFAHQLDAQIRSGVYDDLADAARKLGLTRARVTQILNLTLLAPAIQEEILAMQLVIVGRDPISERTLRPIAAETDWNEQRALWMRLLARTELHFPRS
jgi:hypothetical protein